MSGARTLSVSVRCPKGRVSALACGEALCDLVKYVLYQKLQVPYSYELLRRAVHCRRDRLDIRESLQSSRHFRTTSLAYESLESIFKALVLEMTSSRPPMEVCLVLGATLVSCREAYRLVLPSRQHKPSCNMDHSAAGHQLSLALLKTLTTSEIFEEMINKPLPPTNLHILIRKCANSDSSEPLVDPVHFTPSRGCRVPRSAKLAVIRLADTPRHSLTCCSDFHIFEDLSDSEPTLSDDSSEDNLKDICVMESTEQYQWFQSSVVVKGFKDYCINGSSIANKWLKPQ